MKLLRGNPFYLKDTYANYITLSLLLRKCSIPGSVAFQDPIKPNLNFGSSYEIE